MTVGLDLGDRYSHYCMLNTDGEVIEEGRIANHESALRRQFEGEARQRIAMECGTHSPWISRCLKQLGAPGDRGQRAQDADHQRKRIQK